MRLVTWVSWGLLSVVCALGCGKSDERHGGDGTGGAFGGTSGTAGTSSNGGTSGGARSFMDEFWGAVCKQLMTCEIPHDDEIGQRIAIGTEARCTDLLAQILGNDPRNSDLLAKVAAGTIHFVPENAAACLVEAADCKWQGELPRGPACRGVFEGDVPLGGGCERLEDCAGNAYCSHADGCPGRCTALGEPGAPCDASAECNSGDGYAFCDYSGVNPVCKRLGVSRAGLDQACTASLDGATALVLCDDDLWCDDGDGTLATGLCHQPIPDGAPCDSSNDVCEDGDWCFIGTTCERALIARNAGDACDDDVSPYCDPFASLVCVSNQCQRIGDGTEDAACSSSDFLELVSCNHGLYCATVDSSEGTCAPLLAGGAACESDRACASGTCPAGTCAENYCDG